MLNPEVEVVVLFWSRVININPPPLHFPLSLPPVTSYDFRSIDPQRSALKLPFISFDFLLKVRDQISHRCRSAVIDLLILFKPFK